MVKEIIVGNVKIGGSRPLVLIAGPCVIENEAATLHCAERLMTISNGVSIPLIFKASYDKANRTSVTSYRGPGMKEGLRILAKVKEALGVPVISDIHSIEQVAPAAEVLDVLQIPAFLCRQTDLVVAAAAERQGDQYQEGTVPGPLGHGECGGEGAVCRQRPHHPDGAGGVVRLQQPGVGHAEPSHHARDRVSGGLRRHPQCPASRRPGGVVRRAAGIRGISGRAAVATGIDGIFMEVHEDPEKALCDGPNSIRLDDLPALLKKLKAIDAIVK